MKQYLKLIKQINLLNNYRVHNSSIMTQKEFNLNIEKCRRLVKKVWIIRESNKIIL